MKELVVISGKGGTGKTSLVACFAALSDNGVLADCDVDAADLHLITGARIRHREPFMGGKRARILPELCSDCAECEQSCRFDAVKLDEDPNGSSAFRIDPIACEGCGVCFLVCPAGAIEFKEVINGEWYISETKHGPMVHARLGIAQSNSGKLVSVVRNQARGIAVKRNSDMILIDGPPGIGCPVIASVTGSDFVLVVTEPTLSGLHDLERIRQLAEHFRIEIAACINKYDLNPAISLRIEEHCREKDIEIVGRIPYDNIVTRAQIQKTSVVELVAGPLSDEIQKMWSRILQTIRMTVDARQTHSV